MSDLNFLEQRKLEKLLEMEGGHVLNFSHRTLRHFVGDTVRLDLSDQKYGDPDYSKANRLRAFWKAEPNHAVAQLLHAMMQLHASEALTCGWKLDVPLREECERIVSPLGQASAIADAGAIIPLGEDED